MIKIAKTIFFTAMVTAVLCAGTVSARQWRQTFTTTVCRGFCTKNTPCPNVLGCACVFQPGFTVGTCQLVAAEPAN